MKKPNKIKAFTLVEIIMVMILSLLVLGIITLGYRHFQQYRAMQEKSANSLSEVLMVQNALNNWFHTAKSIRMEDEILLFTDSVQFADCVFAKDFLILRRGNQKDTFGLKTRNFLIEKEGGSPYVKSLMFEVADTGMNHSFRFRKEYGKALLFNWKEKNHEH
nr:type II secretion system protein [uncultured Marinifilum sp.]